MTVATAPRIAAFLNLGENELFQEALASLLRDKKRQVLRARLDILGRYRVQSIGELEAMIVNGTVDEHPAWEDLIVAENLGVRLEELDAHLADL